MKTINAMGRASGTPPLNWLVMATWVLGFVWFIFMLSRYVSPASGQNDLIAAAPFVMATACGLLAWVGDVFAKSLGAGARVLGQRQVPTRLWRRWLLTGLKKTLVHSGFLALVVVTFSLPTPAPWHGLTAAAVMSSVLGVSMLRGLAFHGLAPRVWAWAAPLLVLLLFVGSIASGGFTVVLGWIDNWPWSILLSVSASWPMLALVLTRRWLGQVPQVRMQGAAMQLSLWKKAKTYAQRYTPLTIWYEAERLVPNATKRSAFRVMFLPAYLFLQPSFLPHSWGTGVPVWQVWVLGLMPMLASGTFLVCKDLHWRMLLAPAGMRRGALGWHIALSTATVSFIGTLIAAGAIGGVASAFLSISCDSVTAYLARFCVGSLQLIFAISVGTLIRGTHHTRRWQLGLLSVWVLAGIAGLVWGLTFYTPLSLFEVKWFTVGYPYVFALLALSALAVWAANRLWTVDKLLRCAPK